MQGLIILRTFKACKAGCITPDGDDIHYFENFVSKLHQVVLSTSFWKVMVLIAFETLESH